MPGVVTGQADHRRRLGGPRARPPGAAIVYVALPGRSTAWGSSSRRDGGRPGLRQRRRRWPRGSSGATARVDRRERRQGRRLQRRAGSTSGARARHAKEAGTRGRASPARERHHQRRPPRAAVRHPGAGRRSGARSPSDNADRDAGAAIVAEGANGPTTPEADAILQRPRRHRHPRHPRQRGRRHRLATSSGSRVSSTTSGGRPRSTRGSRRS